MEVVTKALARFMSTSMMKSTVNSVETQAMEVAARVLSRSTDMVMELINASGVVPQALVVAQRVPIKFTKSKI